MTTRNGNRDLSLLLKKAEQLKRLIGNTPLIPIDTYSKERIKIFAKAEWQQFGGSVKSRAAYNMIYQAILEGQLTSEKTILDATSGNTGIALASIGASLGIKVTLALPKNASQKRKEILNALGAEIIYTSPLEGTDGAQVVARELAEEHPEKYFYVDQYSNNNNWRAHFLSTSIEVLEQTSNSITHFIAGLGTTGTFTGTVAGLKHHKPDIKGIALQPDAAMHGLEGWKHIETVETPAIFHPELVDQFIEVSTVESYEIIKEIAEKEGLLLSPSSAANLLGAIKLSEEIEEGVIVTVFPDSIDKYQEVFDQIFGK